MAIASGNIRCPVVRRIAAGLVVAGLITTAICLIIFIVATASAIGAQFQDAGPIGAMALTGLLTLVGLIMAIGGEGLRLLIAIEENTR